MSCRKKRCSGAQNREKKKTRNEENKLLGNRMQQFVLRKPSIIEADIDLSQVSESDTRPNSDELTCNDGRESIKCRHLENRCVETDFDGLKDFDSSQVSENDTRPNSEELSCNDGCESIARDRMENRCVDTDCHGLKDNLCSGSEVQCEEINLNFFCKSADWPTDPVLYAYKDIVDNDTLRRQIVAHGPCQPTSSFKFPVDRDGRHFSTFHFDKKMQSGNKVARLWLCYSPKSDRVFCFACWLFALRVDPNYEPNFAEIGINNWGHLSQKIKKHEISSCHLDALGSWKLWQTGKTVDSEMRNKIKSEVCKLRQVFHRLLDITLYLSKQNMAFRGNHEKLGESSSGNFLSTVSLLAKYDPLLSSYLSNLKPGQVNYLSHHIQNELIILASQKVLEKLLEKVRRAKFFSIIADTTTDISHIDQLSFTVRYVDMTEQSASGVESFTGFIPVSDATAAGLTDTILTILEKKLQLKLSDCRGQGFDGAAVMSGIYNGVSTKIMALQPLALYVHCTAHCLNLVLCDAAETSVEVKTFFGIIQKLYVFLSSSNFRWDKFIHTASKVITVKKICATRWEARIDAVQAVIASFQHILLCLQTIRDDPKRRCKGEELVDINSLSTYLNNFQFVFLLVVWEKILLNVRVASKILQKSNTDISSAEIILKAALDDMETFRNDGFQVCYEEAVQFASKNGVAVGFSAARNRKKKKQFDETSGDELTDPTKKFECQVFNPLVDAVVIQMKKRLAGTAKIAELFDFLTPRKLGSETDFELKRGSEKLCEIYSNDINSTDLLCELKSFKKILPTHLKKCSLVLSYIAEHKLEEVYPNVANAYKILLTIPVSVASSERSFSKLRLIKNYLRSSMVQERLSALSLLSIESEEAATLDFDDTITTFAETKARKKKIS